MYDVIPDIHGQADKLTGLLTRLGYRERNGAWRHSDPTRSAVFLGDFIDRGPENAKVIRIVRAMMEASTAQAIMGNHELNAIQFHTPHDQTGEPLRPHSAKNMKQHGSFLAEHPVGSDAAVDAITWMKRLPLFLEFDGFRVVHACWNETKIDLLRALTTGAVMTDQQFVDAADKTTTLYDLVETTTKGPELPLPPGYFFTDKDGTRRKEIRLKWWQQCASGWSEVAISVPDPSELPDGQIPPETIAEAYPENAKPVFFGHYWLDGRPTMQAPNALCLDYSAGRDGPLVSYRVASGSEPLSLEQLGGHQGLSRCHKERRRKKER